MATLKRKKRIILILALMAIILVILAAGLPELELKSGRALEFTPGESSPGNEILSIAVILMTIYRVILILAGVLFPLAIIFFLRTKAGRKRLLVLVIVAAAFLLIMGNVDKLKLDVEPLELAPIEALEESPKNVQEEEMEDPPYWFITLISFIISAVILGLVIYLWYRFKPRPDSLDEVAQKAEETIEEIKAGGNLKQGIIRCYFEMSEAMDKERGVKRQVAMTTREFESRLGEAGLDLSPVIRLTRLFEKVRYGDRDLGKSEENEAVSCLTEIIESIRRPA
jgi:hypothetical protein